MIGSRHETRSAGETLSKCTERGNLTSNSQFADFSPCGISLQWLVPVNPKLSESSDPPFPTSSRGNTPSTSTPESTATDSSTYVVVPPQRYTRRLTDERGILQRAPVAVKAVLEFARKQMGTKKVLIDPSLNAAIWDKGIKNVPHRIRVRLSRTHSPFSTRLAVD